MNSLKFQDRLLGLQDNLLNFAYMLTANREEAKDLLQDTTLKALDNEDKYIDNVNFKGWVFTIMRNIFINNYRRVVRNQTIIDQTEDLYHLNLPQDSGFASPEGSFTVKEEYRGLWAFSDFNDECRRPRRDAPAADQMQKPSSEQFKGLIIISMEPALGL